MNDIGSRILAGAMSGTSADGVEVALVRVMGRGLDMSAELLVHHHRDYPPELRAGIFEFREDRVGKNVLPRLGKMGREISLCHALAVNEALASAHLNANDLAAVA